MCVYMEYGIILSWKPLPQGDEKKVGEYDLIQGGTKPTRGAQTMLIVTARFNMQHKPYCGCMSHINYSRY